MEDRVSRTQFQYTLEDPNADELNSYAPQVAGRYGQSMPELRDVASDQQNGGLQARLVFDRNRLTPGHHRIGDRSDAVRRLRPAPGLDDLHAVESVSRRSGSDARVQKDPFDLRDLFIRTGMTSLPALRRRLGYRRFLLGSGNGSSAGSSGGASGLVATSTGVSAGAPAHRLQPVSPAPAWVGPPLRFQRRSLPPRQLPRPRFPRMEARFL